MGGEEFTDKLRQTGKKRAGRGGGGGGANHLTERVKCGWAMEKEKEERGKGKRT